MLKPTQEANGTLTPLENCPLWGLHFKAALTGRRGCSQSPPHGDMTPARRSRSEHMTAAGPELQGTEAEVASLLPEPT